jgi:DNA-binding CsgD family transcriptional regulator
MFNETLGKLVGEHAVLGERAEGVAFLRTAKALYPDIATLSYLGCNIALRARSGRHLHCSYSDSTIRYCISPSRVRIDDIDIDDTSEFDPDVSTGKTLVFRLRPLYGESAVFGIALNNQDADISLCNAVMRDFQVLANYFHQHIMRIYGHDASRHILMSARELDCLKWIAEGKTAWEASVILGISERTVRFHLNSAREKMQCATTTQAVARAVSQSLI